MGQGFPNYAGTDAAFVGGQQQMMATGNYQGQVMTKEGQAPELPPTANKAKWQRNYDLLDDKDRQEMLVDEIFALYLYRMSNRINFNYYRPESFVLSSHT